jgi:hypothetical protein
MEDNVDLVIPSLFNIREEISTVDESSTNHVTCTATSKSEIMVSRRNVMVLWL